MVYACPAESDPRDKLEDFVKNPEHKTIAGLRTEGLQTLIDLVRAEIEKQEPDSETVFLDREVLADNSINFASDLGKYLEKLASSGKRVNVLLSDDLPVVDWQSGAAKLKGKNAQVYCFSVACRQIPSCSKLL